eukprot:scaffold13983_cov61-Phaeocystis_antarctica.AAC.2
MKSILDRFGARLNPVNDAVRWGVRLATVRRQFVGLGRSRAAQIPLMSCLSSHATSGGSREVELISAELARSQVASVIFGVRTSLGRCTFSSSVLRIGMIYGGPDTSRELSLEPCQRQREHRATWR